MSEPTDEALLDISIEANHRWAKAMDEGDESKTMFGHVAAVAYARGKADGAAEERELAKPFFEEMMTCLEVSGVSANLSGMAHKYIKSIRARGEVSR